MPGTEIADAAAVPFDPYELKDVVGGTSAIRTPSPRAPPPVARAFGADRHRRGHRCGDPTAQPITVFGFDEVVQVLRDNETFSSVVYGDVMGMVMGHTVLEMDEPEHRQIRALVAGSFRSKMLERWEEDLVALVVNELIDSFIDAGQTDLVRTLTFNFPVQVIARILVCPAATTPASSAGRSSSRASRPTGSVAWPPRRPCGTTSPRSWPSVGPRRATISSATWCGPRSTASS